MVTRILLAGESWMSYTTHVKGADAFYTSVYETGEKYLKAALEEGGYEFTFLPNHLATEEFPFTMDGLRQYDLIILSDIGANTLLLPTLTFTRSQIQPNRCSLIKDYVLEGGALLMIGGYLTFSGVDAKGKWQDTPVQDVLPVRILPTDDRMEHCEGVRPVKAADHAVLGGIDTEWPLILGYNKTIAKPEAVIPVKVEDNPFIALGEYGKGRSAAFTTDCAPHWAPPGFCQWPGYGKIFCNLAKWLTDR
ncbi:cytoplasmic protein [Dorea longicatena]|nr:cytoplasmic protein [Dorea longicatena]